MATKTPEIVVAVDEPPPRGGYTARALGHAIFTEGDSLEDLRAMVRDAVLTQFDEDELPRAIRLHFVKDEVIAV